MQFLYAIFFFELPYFFILNKNVKTQAIYYN